MSPTLRPNFAVYVPGCGKADETAVAALASTVGLSPVEARMLLASRLPRRVASTATPDEAAARVLDLKVAGFDAFAVSFETLRSRPPRARTARFADGALEFDPGPRFAAQDGVRLIVHGQILSAASVRTTASSRTKVGTLVPVGGDYQQTGGSEQFLHFYGASIREAVEIRPQAFNFRFLGPQAGPTKAGALKTFLEKIRSLWPAARLDDTLLRVPPSIDESSAVETVEAGRLGQFETERREGSNEGGVMKASLLLAIGVLRPDFP